ncbi:hypothetical protein B0H10DRAFT_2183045 [Mycena sp. CBHHK59/15]|nr:hypothetical protein B0H10DRAFT_2183045 [Mycena sp. CBHHK59/15]
MRKLGGADTLRVLSGAWIPTRFYLVYSRSSKGAGDEKRMNLNQAWVNAPVGPVLGSKKTRILLKLEGVSFYIASGKKVFPTLSPDPESNGGLLRAKDTKGHTYQVGQTHAALLGGNVPLFVHICFRPGRTSKWGITRLRIEWGASARGEYFEALHADVDEWAQEKEENTRQVVQIHTVCYRVDVSIDLQGGLGWQDQDDHMHLVLCCMSLWAASGGGTLKPRTKRYLGVLAEEARCAPRKRLPQPPVA